MSRPPRGGRPVRGDRGAITAELAMGLPLLLAVTVLLVWLLAVGAGQVRAIDAARETARALARGDDHASALAVGRRVAPAGSRFSVRREEGRVVVRVSADVAGPGGLALGLPGASLSAEAVAVEEHGTARGAGVAPGERP